MENQTVVMEDGGTKTREQKNKLGIVGFVFMVLGPAILFLASVVQTAYGDFPEWLAGFVVGVSLVLPAAGFIMGIISLVLWKKSGIWGRALAIVTVIMCNPFFYWIYFIICMIYSQALAGLPWM